MGDLFDADDDAGTARLGTGLMGGGLPAIHQQAAVVIKAPVGTTLASIPGPAPCRGRRADRGRGSRIRGLAKARNGQPP
ncbi:hypothetical protein SANTM175S_02693 [Streptomyces antimycoticus]